MKKKNIKYKQCKLKRGMAYDVAWIPEQFAKMGEFLEIKDVDGWEVVSVGHKVLEYDDVNDRSREHLHTREVTDI